MTTKKAEPAAAARNPADPEGSEMPAVFDADRLYDVQLLKPILQEPFPAMSPAHQQTIKGDICEAHRDKIWRAVINDSGVQEVR